MSHVFDGPHQLRSPPEPLPRRLGPVLQPRNSPVHSTWRGDEVLACSHALPYARLAEVCLNAAFAGYGDDKRALSPARVITSVRAEFRALRPSVSA